MSDFGSGRQHVKVYLGLGSNLGDRAENLAVAARRLSEGVSIGRVSSVYETDPVGYADQPRFLNATLEATTELSPEGLLSLAKEIERDMGRRGSFRNGPRLIDIDILFYSDREIDEPELTVPHPRLAERAFVLTPLAEIAPDLVHPLLGRTIAELSGGAGEAGGVHKVGTLETLRTG